MKYPGDKRQWEGFDAYDFSCDGRASLVVVPRRVAGGRPWVWRTQFFGHEPQSDLALLHAGFHAAFMDLTDMLGGPEALTHMSEFHRFLTGELGLAKKTVLSAFSRGGLDAYNWACLNPDKVACLYADAPVCDIRSWPGGKGKGIGDERCWELCKAIYGLTEETAGAFGGNPIDNLAPLARAGVPILHVCGGDDEAVPMPENSDVLERRYRALGGAITVIVKPGGRHHPHSLKDPTPIVEFILTHAQGPRSRKRPGTRPGGEVIRENPPAGGSEG